MLRFLGLTTVSWEAVFWFGACLALVSTVVGYFVDSIMGRASLGVTANALALWGGSMGGLVLWNMYWAPLRSMHATDLAIVCVGSSFLLLLVLSLMRRPV